MTDRQDAAKAAQTPEGAAPRDNGGDPDDLTADNEVEEDTLATVDPDNPPA